MAPVRPDLALFVESELWPNLILETRARGAPMALVNARLSSRSFRGWRYAPGLARLMHEADGAMRRGSLPQAARRTAERYGMDEMAGKLKIVTR